MTVYIVTAIEWDDPTIQAVFSSREAAEAYVDARDTECTIESWPVLDVRKPLDLRIR